MRTIFVESVLGSLLDAWVLDENNSVLAVCAGMAERDLFARMGFTTVEISNLDERLDQWPLAPFTSSTQDAQNLSYADDAFDFVFVSDGLHHCGSPHRAMLEMYRVARIGVIVVESRDSFTMRLANKLGLSPEFELEAVIDNNLKSGGLNNTQIPNFNYRWTEKEFRKVITAFNPRGKHVFKFFYGLNLPYETAAFKRTRAKYFIIKAAHPFLKLFTLLFRRQRNSFAMVALKPDSVWPWLTENDGDVAFNADYARKRFRGLGD